MKAEKEQERRTTTEILTEVFELIDVLTEDEQERVARAIAARYVRNAKVEASTSFQWH